MMDHRSTWQSRCGDDTRALGGPWRSWLHAVARGQRPCWPWRVSPFWSRREGRADDLAEPGASQQRVRRHPRRSALLVGGQHRGLPATHPRLDRQGRIQDAEAPPAGARPIVETACVARSRRIASTPARVSDARDARWGSRRPHRAQRIGWASSRPRTPGSGRVSGRASGMRPARGPSSSAGQGAHAHEGEMSSWRSSSSSPRERPARCSQNAMAAHAEAQGEARPSQDGPEWALALHPSATSQLAGSDGMLAPRCAEGRRPTASLIDLGLGDQHRGRDGAAAGGAAGGVR